MRKAVVVLLLVLASLQCGRAMFYSNVEYMNVVQFENGTERMPFQGRALMVPLMRFAHSSPALNRIAARTNGVHEDTPEPQSPEKLFCGFLACICILGMGLVSAWEAARRGLPWWLPWTLILVILFVSYAARTSQNYWYPYDAPEFFMFAAGTVFLYQRRFLALLFLMPIIAANRETAIFLVLLWLCIDWQRSRPWPALLRSAALLVPYLIVRLWISHHYPHPASVTGFRWAANLRDLRSPKDWPQIASALGFLWPLPWLFWRHLSQLSRRLLIGSIPCLFITLAFGMWIESRVFDEFTALLALMCTEIFVAEYVRRDPEKRFASAQQNDSVSPAVAL